MGKLKQNPTIGLLSVFDLQHAMHDSVAHQLDTHSKANYSKPMQHAKAVVNVADRELLIVHYSPLCRSSLPASKSVPCGITTATLDTMGAPIHELVRCPTDPLWHVIQHQAACAVQYGGCEPYAQLQLLTNLQKVQSKLTCCQRGQQSSPASQP